MAGSGGNYRTVAAAAGGSLLLFLATGCGKTRFDAAGPLGTAGQASAGGGGSSSAGSSAAAAGASSAGTSLGGADAGVLQPLDTSDATIAATSAGELILLAIDVGFAQGYAQCRCLLPPPLPPQADLEGCAQEESGLQLLFEPERAQCVFQESSAVPGFDDYLRCKLRELRARGKHYLACSEGQSTPSGGEVPVPPCQNDAAEVLLQGETCRNAFWCSDGTLLPDAHCDSELDCPNGEDERGCGALECGDKLVDRFSVCDPQVCALPFEPPLCSPDTHQFSCGDGAEVFLDEVCDGDFDCATGRDEKHCF